MASFAQELEQVIVVANITLIVCIYNRELVPNCTGAFRP